MASVHAAEARAVPCNQQPAGAAGGLPASPRLRSGGAAPARPGHADRKISTFRCFFIRACRADAVNMRYVAVGAVLAAIVAFAFFMGSPMFGGFDVVR